MSKKTVSKFWQKVLTCHHEWSKHYSAYLRCNTPNCSGTESKCKKCGVYRSTCGCGGEEGLSGWPERRHQEHYIKQAEKRLAKQMKGV